MTDVYVIGVGMTCFGSLADLTVANIARGAVTDAIKDSGCNISDLDAAYFSNSTQGALQGQHMIRGQVALRPLGIQSIPIVNVENACASAATAFNMAYKDIKSGQSQMVLAVGSEKMIMPDKNATMAVFEGAMDIANAEETMKGLLNMSVGFEMPPEAMQDSGLRSKFMDVYSAMSCAHMQEFGTTQRDLAVVAAKNHKHSVHNSRSQYRKAFSVEEILAARLVSWPLTLPMCSPVSDGGAAAILCSQEALSRFGSKRAIRVCASILVSGSDRVAKDHQRNITRMAASKAYESAGLGPDEISLAEVHDATAFGEIIQSEALGLCSIGEGGAFATSGATTLGGQVPINPSGGLESKGHPIGATGLGQIFELVTQLRGEAGARQVDAAHHAIAENGGGIYGVEEAAAAITILGKK